MVSHTRVNGAGDSQLAPCSFSFDNVGWIEAGLESHGRKAVGPLAHTPGWDFYDIAVDNFVLHNEKAVLRVKRQAPIRLVRIFSRWPSSEPPLAVALRPEGVGIADVALPPPVMKMERLLVAVCPSGSKAMDTAFLAKCRKKESRPSEKISHKHQRSGESLLASAAEAEAAELEAEAEMAIRPRRHANTVDGSGTGSQRRRASAKSLAEAAAEVAAEFAGGHSSSSSSRKSHKVLLQAAEEAAREAEDAEEALAPPRSERVEVAENECLTTSHKLDDFTPPTEEVTKGTMPSQKAADLEPATESASHSPSKSIPEFEVELPPAVVTPEEKNQPAPQDNSGNESGKCDEDLEAMLRSEIARLSAEVEEQRFARGVAKGQRKKLQEERDDFMRRVRSAERAQMLSDMQVRTLTSELTEARRQAAGHERRHSKDATPSSIEDIVKALVTYELGQMRTCSPEERASTKRKLLRRWHPDKNSGVGCGDLLTRVVQEMQTRTEWTSS